MINGKMPAMPTLTYDHGAAMQGLAVSVTDAPGLTKREMMAMHMMAGLNANPTVEMNEHDMATLSVAYADALLYELERTCHKT